MKKAPLLWLVMALLIGLAVCQLALPGREKSEMENRLLASFPTFTAQKALDGSFSSELETFAADQLPLRDQFVSLYSTMQYALGRRAVEDAILGKDGMMFDQSQYSTLRNVQRNTQALQSLAEQTGKETLLLAVPSAAAIYPENLPAHAPVADEKMLLQSAVENISTLPLYEALVQQKSVPQFYATDHHWTAEGAYTGYRVVCERLHLSTLPMPERASHSGFYGSFYARYPLPWQKSDVFSYPLMPDLRLIINGEEKQGYVDEDALQGRDKYASLFYGNHGRMELVNPEVPSGELLVIKDSYANALLPLLSQHYHRIIVIDPRYYPENIVELTNTYQGDAVLCVYGMSNLSTGRTIALMEGL